MDNKLLQNQTPPAKKRIWELDFVRGVCILLMIVDHLMLSVGVFFADGWFPLENFTIPKSQLSLGAGAFLEGLAGGAFIDGNWLVKFCYFSKWYWSCDIRGVIHPIVFCLFIAICGLSCTFSKNNMKRGCLLALIAYGFTLVTGLILPDDLILFGILQLLAVGIIIWAVLNTLLRANKTATAIVSLCIATVLLIIYFCLNNSLKFMASISAESPIIKQILLDTHLSPLYNKALFFNTASVSPGDFFPILPWLSVFFFGAGLGQFVYGKKKSLVPALDGVWNKPVCFFGRHTLIIYVFHQIVIVGLLMLLSYFVITPGDWIFF